MSDIERRDLLKGAAALGAIGLPATTAGATETSASVAPPDLELSSCELARRLARMLLAEGETLALEAGDDPAIQAMVKESGAWRENSDKVPSHMVATYATALEIATALDVLDENLHPMTYRQKRMVWAVLLKQAQQRFDRLDRYIHVMLDGNDEEEAEMPEDPYSGKRARSAWPLRSSGA